jgi:arylsulfatase A-like enzyme/Tfp pilus assembly protein PilF
MAHGSRRTRSTSGASRISRRAALGLLIFVVLIAAAAAAWRRESTRRTFPAFTKTADQNVLLITIDTLRADALGSYGGRARTPNLDGLAATGVRFTFAHAHAVMTLPSHTNIMTGRYPFEHGVRDNAGFRLGESVTTLAELARQKGLATGAFVGAFPLDRQFGLARGFDVYDDLGGREVAPADFALAERNASEVVTAASRWIEHQQRPWLAWVHVFDPHSPYAPPPPFDREYARDPYAGEVAYVDDALKPLLDLARRASRPTTIIVTADHGEGLGDHGEATHGVFAYESTLHIPLILAQVGTGVPGRRADVTSDVPVRHIDILPTITDVLTLPAPPDLHGRTLLLAQPGEQEPRPSYFEAMTAMLKRGWAPLQGIVVDRDKYIDLPIDELYDLAADPREERNRTAVDSARVRALTVRLGELSTKLPDKQMTESAEARARLQSLGYLSGSAPRKAQYGEDDDPKRLVDVDRMMLEGIERHREGRPTEAMDLYRNVIARRPDMALAYRRLAYMQWESGATRDAIATLREALRRNGPDTDVEVRLGTYLAETGALAEATTMLEAVVRADAQNREALNALGIAYAHAGSHTRALGIFQRILAIDPRDAFALENVGAVHLERHDLRAAEDAFKRAAANDPRSSRAEAGLGVVAIESGRRDAAIAHWRRAVDLDATNLDALYNLGTELAAANRMAEARPYLERFLRAAAGVRPGDVARARRLLSAPGR